MLFVMFRNILFPSNITLGILRVNLGFLVQFLNAGGEKLECIILPLQLTTAKSVMLTVCKGTSFIGQDSLPLKLPYGSHQTKAA